MSLAMHADAYRHLDNETLNTIYEQHRRNLQHLSVQAAGFGQSQIPVPLHTQMGDEFQKIQAIEAEFQRRGMTTEVQSEQTETSASAAVPSETERKQALELLASMPSEQAQALPPIDRSLKPTLRVPFRRNRDFVGRESELRQLAEGLKHTYDGTFSPAVAISGIPGIGKTNLATEFVYRYSRFFAGGVYWINCENPAQIEQEIAACAARLKLEQQPDSSQADHVTQVLMHWKQALPSLIIFDHCDDPSIINTYRAQLGPYCRVLVTSCYRTWERYRVPVVVLEPFERATSVQLLQHLASHLTQPEAEQIATQLGDHPLALYLAANYLHDYFPAVDEYCERLQLDSLQHVSLCGRGSHNSPTEHILNVEKTFAKQFQKLQQHTEQLDLINHFLACMLCFAPDHNIPREFLLKLAPETVDRDDTVDVLRDLLNAGLITGFPIPKLHRFWHIYLNRMLSVEQRNTAQKSVIAVWNTKKEEITPTENLYQAHLEHLATQLLTLNDLPATTLMHELVELLAPCENLNIIEQLEKHALTTRKQTLGTQHTETAYSMCELAGTYSQQGRHVEAEQLHNQALAIRETLLGEQHLDTARSLFSIGVTYSNQEKYGEAAAMHERALAIREGLLGEQHLDTAWSLYWLGATYSNQEKYGEAAAMHERALAIREGLLGEQHLDTAWSLYNLGITYYRQEKYGEAAAMHERGLAIRERLLGEQHLDTAQSLYWLGATYSNQEKYGEAAAMHERALAIREGLLGEQHLDTAQSLYNLGVTYYNQGTYAEAAAMEERALAIRERLLGEQHLDTAWSLIWLGAIYYQQETYSKAAAMHERALAIREGLLGEQDLDTAHSLANLGVTYYRQGKYVEAAAMHDRALAIREGLLGEQHLETAQSLRGLGTTYFQQGKYSQAKPLYERAVRIAEEKLGAEHATTQWYRRNYQDCLSRLK